MLHILLWILKIVGILLAVLLGILLFGLICVLFVPVRYRIEADGKTGGESPVRAEVKISWLLHIISAAFTYREAARIRIKIFCFPIFDSAKHKKSKKSEKKKQVEKKDKKKRKKKKQSAETADKAEENAGEGKIKEDKAKEDKAKEDRTKEDKAGEDNEKGNKAQEDKVEDKGKETGEKAQTGTSEDAACISETDISRNQTAAERKVLTESKTENILAEGIERDGGAKHTEREDAEGATKEKEESKGKIKSFVQALWHFFERLLAALKNIEYTIKRICDKIRNVMENIQYYTEVLKSEAFRGAWEVSKKQLLRILRMLRPRTCSIHLLAGTGDPAGTGQLLAFYGILYPFIGNYVSVEADFENKVMEGSLLIRGRITMFVFLTAAFQLFVNKNIRRLLKMMKKEDM